MFQTVGPPDGRHKRNMCVVDLGCGDGALLLLASEMQPGKLNRFVGFETNQCLAKQARSKLATDQRTTVFSHSFLLDECRPDEREEVERFFHSGLSPTCYIIHYLNNFNYRMADIRKDNSTLESKLVKQMEDTAQQRLVARSTASRKYVQAEVLVTLHPVPTPDGWTKSRIPFNFDEPGMAFSWDPSCTSGSCYQYVAPDPEMVINHGRASR